MSTKTIKNAMALGAIGVLGVAGALAGARGSPANLEHARKVAVRLHDYARQLRTVQI